jgi:hypothetical protein
MHLVLWVCLLAQPAACREERVPTEARAALVMECKAAMEEWATGHPWLAVNRWQCRPAEHRA